MIHYLIYVSSLLPLYNILPGTTASAHYYRSFITNANLKQGMVSEYEIRKRIGFNDENVRQILQNCIAAGSISAQINIDTTLIVFHGFFCGLIKKLVK
ncbi:Probable acrEF/envCD operon repressor [Leclercia adecarboxylata]|uniref:Probable acrEF/envCD operon repressor n=1 Tax=Leclercia adecarboxylata TaxID=83655 RepID=A0A4U9IRE1_9ENTR|nr:Probable acrEF/envCD operon repressor [Leclercia adecarboxylata]